MSKKFGRRKRSFLVAYYENELRLYVKRLAEATERINQLEKFQDIFLPDDITDIIEEIQFVSEGVRSVSIPVPAVEKRKPRIRQIWLRKYDHPLKPGGFSIGFCWEKKRLLIGKDILL